MMISFDHENHEISSDGVTVWVNDDTGYCIGRFGRMGIDIHAHQTSQNECLFCTHKKTTHDDWLLFIKKMREFYNVTGLEPHQPMY